MVRFITVDELLPIRNEMLRWGKLPLDECRFPTDNIAGAFHLGYFEEDELVSIASFHPQAYGSYTGTGYQLRGMATLTAQQGKGLGAALVSFAIKHLKNKSVNYLWCNARKIAVPFYEKAGFKIVSAEFEVKDIGPHYVMHINLS